MTKSNRRIATRLVMHDMESFEGGVVNVNKMIERITAALDERDKECVEKCTDARMMGYENWIKGKMKKATDDKEQ